MRISENFVTATPKSFGVFGNFFRIRTATAGIDVEFRRAGKKLAENLVSATSAEWAYPEGGFDQVIVTSSGNQLVEFDIYAGRVGSDAVQGNVSLITGPAGAHVPAAVAITNASAVILAANAARKYLLIQNAHASDTLWVRCDGVAAAATPACLAIPAGGVWEPPFVPTGEIRGIRSVASGGNNVHVIEG